MAYVACNLPKGAQKRKMAVFHEKMHFSGRKAATKFLCVKTVNDKVVAEGIGLWIRAKIIGGDAHFYLKIWRTRPHPLANADFQSIFACSASAVTPSKKVQLTL